MQIAPSLLSLQRARGRAEIALHLQDGAVRLQRLYQEGCAKAILPRTHGGGPEAVLINTAGGLTGGDRLHYAITLGARASLTATTQAAERVYRAAGGTARLTVALTLGPEAVLDWLPQETILFDGGRIERRIDADMPIDARLSLLECLVLGRAAMGETVTSGHFADHWRIRRGGRLVHAEALRLTGDSARAGGGRATLGGARALATFVHVAPDAEARLAEARALLADLPDVEAAASARGGVLVLRMLAPDHAPMRRALARFLTAFRARPLPRVWSL